MSRMTTLRQRKTHVQAEQEIGRVARDELYTPRETVMWASRPKLTAQYNPTSFKLIRALLITRASQYRAATIFIVQKLPTAVRQARPEMHIRARACWSI